MKLKNGTEGDKTKKKRVVEESIRQHLDVYDDKQDGEELKFNEQESYQPLDLSKLKRMSEKFPKDYPKRLECMLIERDQAY